MELKNKYIVLTGSKGLIGNAIARELKKKNKIISIDKYEIKTHKNVDHYICDLENRKDRNIVSQKIKKNIKKLIF